MEFWPKPDTVRVQLESNLEMMRARYVDAVHPG